MRFCVMRKVLVRSLNAYYKSAMRVQKNCYEAVQSFFNAVLGFVNNILWLTYIVPFDFISKEPSASTSGKLFKNELKYKYDSGRISSTLDKKFETVNSNANKLFLNNVYFTDNQLFNDLLKATSLFKVEDYDKFGFFVNNFIFLLRDFSINLYDRLSDKDKKVFIMWILKQYANIDILTKDERAFIDSQFELARSLDKFDGEDEYVIDLSKVGYIGVKIHMPCDDYWYRQLVVMADFIRKQYKYDDVYIKEGDIILDCGGFVGDTALGLGYDAGWDCQIHSFEINDENIDFINRNIAENPQLKDVLKVNKLALSNVSGETIYFNDKGAASKVGSGNANCSATTITIDDYVKQQNLPKVDFIKMDMEGAELSALEGASETIAKFKPKLALSIYHEIDDCKKIPEIILKYNPDYKFYFNWHNQRDGFEAILYAR